MDIEYQHVTAGRALGLGFCGGAAGYGDGGGDESEGAGFERGM